MSMSAVAAKSEFRWSLLVWLACLLMVVFMTSCSAPAPRTPISTCQGIDWYEIGRRDGATGASLTMLDEYKQQCRKDQNHPDAELYTNGRNAGLVEYCTPQVGLETARFGRKYVGVCPSHMEKPFLKGFAAGQKIRSLEADNTSIDGQISTLVRSVSAVDGGTDSSTTSKVTGGTASARNPASADASDSRTKIASLHKRHATNDAAIATLEQSVQSPSTKN